MIDTDPRRARFSAGGAGASADRLSALGGADFGGGGGGGAFCFGGGGGGRALGGGGGGLGRPGGGGAGRPGGGRTMVDVEALAIVFVEPRAGSGFSRNSIAACLEGRRSQKDQDGIQ